MFVRAALTLLFIGTFCSWASAATKGANNPPAKFKHYVHAYGSCEKGFEHVNRYKHYLRTCFTWCNGRPDCAAFHWKWISGTGINAWGHCTFYQRHCRKDEYTNLMDHVHHTYIRVGHPGFDLPGFDGFMGACPELPKRAVFQHYNQNPRSCANICNKNPRCKSFQFWANNFCQGWDVACTEKEADKGKQNQIHWTKKPHWVYTWVFKEPRNLALGKSVAMSLAASASSATYAVDGNYYGIPGATGYACAVANHLYYHTPYILVKLGSFYLVKRVVITNRIDEHSNKMKDFVVAVIHAVSWNHGWLSKIEPDMVCGKNKNEFAGHLSMTCPAPILGKSVLVQMNDIGRKRGLTACEIEVYKQSGYDPMQFFEEYEKHHCPSATVLANHYSSSKDECALICMSDPKCGAFLRQRGARTWCYFYFYGCEDSMRKAHGSYDIFIKSGHPGMEIAGFSHMQGRCKSFKHFRYLVTTDHYKCGQQCNMYDDCEGFYWVYARLNYGTCYLSKQEICDEDSLIKGTWTQHVYSRIVPNVALYGKAYGSSFDGHFTPGRAVDGVMGMLKHLRTCFSSKRSRDNWWAVDLGFNTRVKKIMLFGTRKGDFDGIRSIVTDDQPRNGAALKFVDNEVCDEVKGRSPRKAKMSCSGKKVGRYVIIHRQTKHVTRLEICEALIMGIRDYRVNDYVMEEDKHCNSHDVIATKKGLTPGDCADVCNQDARCFSFSYKEINKAKQCWFKGALCSTGLATINKAWKATQIWIHYVKAKHPGLEFAGYESFKGLYFHGYNNLYNARVYPDKCAQFCEKDKRCHGFRLIMNTNVPYCQALSKWPASIKPTIKNALYYTLIKQAEPNIAVGKIGLGVGRHLHGPIDGIISGWERHASCFISKPAKGRSWYAVNLALRGRKYIAATRKWDNNAIVQKAFYVKAVKMLNRADACCVAQMKQLTIIVTDNEPLKPHDEAEICGKHDKATAKAGKWLKIKCRFPITGQYVVIRKDGNEPFGICELMVSGWPSTDKNVAMKKKTDISSSKGRTKPEFAVDGKLNTNVGTDMCAQTLTNLNGKAAWWSVDLAETYFISAVTLRSRTDCCPQSLSQFTISVSTSKPRWNFEPIKEETCNYVQHTVPLKTTWSVKCRDPSIGQYVIVSQNIKGSQLTICEAEIFGRHMKIEKPVGFWPLTAGLKGTDVAIDTKKQRANGRVVDVLSRPGPLNKPYTAFTIKRGGASAFLIPRHKKIGTRYDFTFMLYIFQSKRVDDAMLVTWDSEDRKLIIKNKRLVLRMNSAMDEYEVVSKQTIPVDRWVLVGAGFNYKTATGQVYIDDQITEKKLGSRVKPSSTSMDDIIVGKGHYFGGIACMQLYKVPMTLMEFTGASSRCKHYMKKPGDMAVNIAKSKPAFQSSTWNGAAAIRAVDGDDAPNMWRKSCSATIPNSDEHWWAVDLQDLRLVTSVKMTNRLDCCHKRLRDFRVLVTTDKPTKPLGFDAVDVCVHQKKHMQPGQSKIFSCREGGLVGKYVSVTKTGKPSLTLCEVEVFGDKVLFKLKKGHVFIWRTSRVEGARRGEKKILKEVANLKLCQRACLSEKQFLCLSVEYEYLKKRCRLYDDKMKLSDHTKKARQAATEGWFVVQKGNKVQTKKVVKKDDKKAKIEYLRKALAKVEKSRDLLQATKQAKGQVWEVVVDRIKLYQRQLKDLTRGVPKLKKKLSGRLEPGISRAPFVYSEPRSMHPRKATLPCPRGKSRLWKTSTNWVLNQAPMKNINGIMKQRSCRKLCDQELNFVCLSYAFNKELKTCSLWDQNTATPGLKLVMKLDYTYSQWGCGGMGKGCECISYGDPHYTGFHGGRGRMFQLPCKYTAVKSIDREDECTFDIESKNQRYPHPRSGVSVQVMVDVKIFGHVFRFKKGGVYIDGKRYTDFTQANRIHPDVVVRPDGLAIGSCQLWLQYGGYYRIHIKVGANYWAGGVEGFCGNCVTKSPAPYQFSKYMVPDDSGLAPSAGCKASEPPHKCTGTWATKVKSNDFCGHLRNFHGPFKHCIRFVNYNKFQTDCIFDVCQYTHNPTEAIAQACDALGNLADKCASLGKQVLPWRRPDFCPMECQRNAEYQTQVSACPATCDDPDAPKNCDMKPKEGCACKTGFVLNAKNKCVVKDLCAPKSLADIVFLIDMSDLMGPQLAARAKDLVADIIDTFDISPKTTQISVIPYACGGAVNTLLYTAYSSRPELVEATRNLPFVGGCSKLPKALDHVYEKVINPALEKVRPGDIYSKMIVLVTPDDVADNDAVVEKTKNLVRKMGKVIWIKYNSERKPPARDLTIPAFIFPIADPTRVETIIDSFSFMVFKEVKCGRGFYKHVTKFSERCSDIDECRLDVCSKGSTCINTNGGYRCACKPGYCFHKNLGCIDNNECSVNPCLPGSQCKNNVGSYTCICKTGFQYHPKRSCFDIDECETTKNKICHKNSVCKNTLGSYKCECNKQGYVYKSDQGCAIGDVCKAKKPCKGIAKCENTKSGYKCNCPKGYKPNGKNGCSEINKCEPNPCRGKAVCRRNFDSYICICDEDFDYTKRGCVRKDPCDKKPCKGGAHCTSENGEFYCACLGDMYYNEEVGCEEPEIRMPESKIVMVIDGSGDATKDRLEFKHIRQAGLDIGVKIADKSENLNMGLIVLGGNPRYEVPQLTRPVDDYDTLFEDVLHEGGEFTTKGLAPLITNNKEMKKPNTDKVIMYVLTKQNTKWSPLLEGICKKVIKNQNACHYEIILYGHETRLIEPSPYFIAVPNILELLQVWVALKEIAIPWLHCMDGYVHNGHQCQKKETVITSCKFEDEEFAVGSTWKKDCVTYKCMKDGYAISDAGCIDYRGRCVLSNGVKKYKCIHKGRLHEKCTCTVVFDNKGVQRKIQIVQTVKPSITIKTDVAQGKGKNCVLPFLYAGNVYNECTNFMSDTPWCATVVDLDKDHNAWGYCVDETKARCAQEGVIKFEGDKWSDKNCWSYECHKGGKITTKLDACPTKGPEGCVPRGTKDYECEIHGVVYNTCECTGVKGNARYYAMQPMETVQMAYGDADLIYFCVFREVEVPMGQTIDADCYKFKCVALKSPDPKVTKAVGATMERIGPIRCPYKLGENTICIPLGKKQACGKLANGAKKHCSCVDNDDGNGPHIEEEAQMMMMNQSMDLEWKKK